MIEHDLLHNFNIEVPQDGLPYFEEQFDAFLAATFVGEQGEHDPGLLMRLEVLLPHGDEAIHVAVDLEGRLVFAELRGNTLTK